MAQQGQRLMMVGTRKGLWIGRSEDPTGTDWTWDRPRFLMEEVYSCLVDTRGGRTRLLVGSGTAASEATASAVVPDDRGGAGAH